MMCVVEVARDNVLSSLMINVRIGCEISLGSLKRLLDSGEGDTFDRRWFLVVLYVLLHAFALHHVRDGVTPPVLSSFL